MTFLPKSNPDHVEIDNKKKTEGRLNKRGQPLSAKLMPISGSKDFLAFRAQAWEKVIELRLLGKNYKEIALATGFNYRTISNWFKMPEFQLKMQRSRAVLFDSAKKIAEGTHTADQIAKRAVDNVEDKIEKYSVEAIETIHKKTKLTGSATHESVALRASIDLADRGKRTAKTKKVQTTNLHALVTPESLATAMLTAKEISEDRQIGHKVEPIDFNTIDIEALESDDSSPQ